MKAAHYCAYGSVDVIELKEFEIARSVVHVGGAGYKNGNVVIRFLKELA